MTLDNPFPTTIWSRIRRAGEGDASAARAVVETYRPVVERYLRRQGLSAADADDVAQEAFAKILEDGLLAKADRAKGRFRALVYWVAKTAMREWRDREGKGHRGGHEPLPPDSEIAAKRTTVDFDREWWKEVLGVAAERLRAESERTRDLAMARLVGRAEYAEIGTRFKMSEEAAKKACLRALARLRELAVDVIRGYCSSRAEFRTELKMLDDFQKGARGPRRR